MAASTRSLFKIKPWHQQQHRRLLGSGRNLFWNRRSVPQASVMMSNKNTHSPKAFSTNTSLPPLEDGAGQLRLNMDEEKSIGLGGVHDVGGLSSLLGQPIDLTDPTLSAWEQQTHALLLILVKKGFLTTDELRRNIESMQDDHYIMRSYYCKWATSMALGLIERGVITYSELDKELLGAYDSQSTKRVDPEKPKYSVGDSVRVMPEQSLARWRKPHLRTPGYIFGVQGVVESYEGYFPDPSYKAFRSMMLAKSTVGAAVTDDLERKEHLYRIQFRQEDVWPEGKKLAGSQSTAPYDTVAVEIYENWLLDDTLEAAKTGTWEMDPSETVKDSVSPTKGHHDHDHGHDHGHDHDHEDHTHLSRPDLEQRAVDLELSSRLCSSGSVETEMEPTLVVGDRLSAALISLMSQPDRFGEDLHNQLRETIDAMESAKVRADGAALVTRAWTDPEFEQRLLEDAASAAFELGINATNATAPTKLKVVKSEMPTATQPGVHNIITCTLCSCYPLSLLGLAPKWYKSRSYRARTVREPRAMLSDSFGLTLKPEEWTIRVHDSTADLRYLVLPPRPPNTEGWSEEELRKLVTRDTMIGVALPSGCV
eukprot:Nitzschia sp. Nitz4//scaffold316_size20630//16653//18437//NITZ4_008658-RA/size20630-processed-gene-0.16-mRNA-1//1//CDS//3329547520//337//frame0